MMSGSKLADLLLKESGVPEFLKKLHDKLILEESIVLFGAGSGGIAAYDWMLRAECAKNIVAFCDNNPRKWNTCLRDRPVIAPDTLQNEYADAFIMITCGEGDEIELQLQRMGFATNRIVMPDISGIDENGLDYRYIWDHISELELVYNLLADDKSKKVFSNILNYRISHNISLIEEVSDSSDEQYFDEDLILFSQNDIFVNCGSYIGDTIENYLQRSNNTYKKFLRLRQIIVIIAFWNKQ